MVKIIPFHVINLSSILAGNYIVALAVDSGGAAQIVVKGGRVLVPDGTIYERGAAVLYIFSGSVHPKNRPSVRWGQ